MAECLGIRALMYFYMVRLWGDCPLLLEPWDFAYETRYNERTSVAEVTAAIDNDLKNSILYFEGAGSRQNTAAYFNLSGAYAFQMDFLTWQRKWAEVITVYEKFTAAYPTKGLVAGIPGEANFMTNVALWKQNFMPATAGTNATETIFSLVYNPAHYGTSVRSPWASDVGYSGSNASFVLSRTTYLLMVQDIWDVRLGGSMRYPSTSPINLVPANAPVYNGPNNNVQAVDKYHANSAFMTFTQNVNWFFPCPIYRYADVILLYAEALNRVSEANGQAVIDIINRIRRSRGSSIVFELSNFPLQLGGSTASRERLIMDERLLEFYGEPKRWFDLIRLDWGFDVIDQHVAYLQGQQGNPIVGFGDKNRILFPISQGNLTRNSKLVQNPGY
jgi:hypothetical protein